MVDIDDLDAFFEKHDGEYGEFEKIKNKKSQRPDVHAFLLLDELVPVKGNKDMVRDAEHDKIWLDTDVAKLVKVATDEQLIELRRCGVLYDNGYDALFMFC